MIEITDLYKYYGERRAIGPLSCSIADGEIVGLLGLNGAGKTTTLRILACDLLPTAGSVRVDGLDVVEQPHEVRSRIGYLPDTPPLYPEMTVRAYLHFAARLRGLPRDVAEKRVPEVEELIELGDVSAQPISSLSHGFKQRVGIAQAIVHSPRLLVLDEPITGLDPVQIVEMRELLRSLKGQVTILLSSHILSEISETCDRILVIKDGQIAAAGTEAELTAKLHAGVRVVVTVSGEGSGRAKAIAAGVEGVTAVDELPPAEPGEGVVTLQVDAAGDVRVSLGRALVQAGLGLLQLGPGERELESIFLELATPAQAERKAARRAKRQDAKKAEVGQAAAEKAEKAETYEERGRMKNTLLLAGRELRAYAGSPIGYVVAAVTLLAEGIYFYALGINDPRLLSTQQLDVFFQAAGGGTMVMAALLSMRLIAGERENGTLVLLNTAPVREHEIVLGKFFAGLAFLTLLALLAAYMPALILVTGKVSLGHVLVGYLGVVLLAASSLSIGLFASAVSPNQIIAALVGGVLLLMLFMLYFVAPYTAPPINGLLNGLSIFHRRQQGFRTGTLKLEDVIFNLAAAYFFLLAATKTLEARRWR